MTPERPAGAAAHPRTSRSPKRARFPGGQEPKRQTGSGEKGLYAALDLGTNSCRMLIARPKGAQFEVVDSFSRAVELGTGLESTGRLGHGPMARTVQALRICRRKLDDHSVSNMRLVATEACRRARNSAEFIRKIQRETGLRLEIIPAEEEARLAVISCAPLVAAETEQLLVIDIGGGSTELVWIDLADVPHEDRRRAILSVKLGLRSETLNPRAKGAARVVDWISVPLGVATLREQFTDVEDDAARFALMSWHFEEQLHDFSPYQNPAPRDGFQIIGTSGTVTTVAASYLGLRRYDRNKVDGLRMTSTQIDKVIRDYLALGPEGRRSDPRIGRERHGLIMSGAAILQALMRVWPTDVMSVADRGLREGLLYAQMTRDGVLTRL
ncbi:Ppx/GppA family phosphatase [Rhodobacter sp. NTK016B]|uniref:Ppx/GppA phosphatase family protein n=1 Tax=Rhodobacter sp. NTK016B TaxID=2759676 RepID=UPI001A8E6EBB|nr:Ppx/GppA phosphatase family protein [Rhodobacter sp. NTK016B]MBN8291226.1 Ppx/GppA family phosphatase [Rhodobacter sp. NTK016B]